MSSRPKRGGLKGARLLDRGGGILSIMSPGVVPRFSSAPACRQAGAELKRGTTPGDIIDKIPPPLSSRRAPFSPPRFGRDDIQSKIDLTSLLFIKLVVGSEHMEGYE